MHAGPSFAPPASIILGPGPYGDRMVEALLEAGLLHEVVRYFPRFRLERAAGARLTPVLDLRAHGAAVRLCWAAWRRLPVLGRCETPRGPLFALVDHLAAARMAPASLLIGWSQVSLHSFRRARAAGRRTLLEHATAHVDTWMDLARRECARRRVRAAYSLLPRLLVRRMRKECLTADHVCVPSTFARLSLRAAGVPDERILQIPLGVDAQRFTPGPPRRGPLRLLYVGRLELLKGVPYLLEAFSRLDLPGAELWLAGRVLPEVGPSLERAAGRAVRVLGPIDHAALPELYRQVDVLAFPSLCDSFGLVLLEAMAAGLPVIATPRSAGPDLIDDGRDGYLVPAADADALLDRLRGIGRDREASRAMGRRAREKVLAGYTWDHYRARYAAACARLLGLTAAGAAP